MRHMTTYRLLDAIVSSGSMRKAAQAMAITPSALNRRVLLIEEEFGVDLFERTTKGLKLSAAGEILIHHVRQQISDLARVESRIADLKGMRAGHVSIASSQAALHDFLPQVIRAYRAEFPAVTFSVQQTTAKESAKLLADFEVDLSIDFDAAPNAVIRTLATQAQSVAVLMHPEHALADKESLHLYDCIDFPLALSTAKFGVRRVLDDVALKLSLDLRPVVEADNFMFLETCLRDRQTLTFRLNAAEEDQRAREGIKAIKLSETNEVLTPLVLNQLKDRSLSVAASRFAELLTQRMQG